MKPNKYTYLKIIQQYHNKGWEDMSEYETNSQGYPKEMTTISAKGTRKGFLSLLAHDLKEYRLMGYATRVIQRKQLK